MTDEQLRNVVADAVGQVHGNLEFVQQIRDGLQDDGPYLMAGRAVRDWFLRYLMPQLDGFDE